MDRSSFRVLARSCVLPPTMQSAPLRILPGAIQTVIQEVGNVASDATRATVRVANCGRGALGARPAIPSSCTERRRCSETRVAAERRGVHQEDQGVSPGPAHHDGARRSSAGVQHRPDAAQVPWPHRRDARRTDVRQGYVPLLRRARRGLGPHQGLAHREDGGGARHHCRRDR